MFRTSLEQQIRDIYSLLTQEYICLILYLMTDTKTKENIMTQTTTTITKISIDQAYCLNYSVKDLTDKSRKVDFEMTIWSINRMDMFAQRDPATEGIRTTLINILHPAQLGGCKKATKKIIVDTVRAYIASLTK
jgi:hypothetical protein